MRYVFLLLLQFFLNYNTLAKETASGEPLSIYLDSLKKLRRDYQITGYNLYRFLGKNSPVRSHAKKKIDKYFGINTELLDILDLIINKKEYPSLYLATEKPLFPSDFWESSQGNSDDDQNPEENATENQDPVSENTAVPNQPNATVNVNEVQNPENSEEEGEEENENNEEEDEAEENPQQLPDAPNPHADANSPVAVNPQPVTVAADLQQPQNPQSIVPANQQPADMINSQLDMNQMLPSSDENFQQYQGDNFTPTDDYPVQDNIESTDFKSDDINGRRYEEDVLIQNNGNKDNLGNFLMKAQLAKNAFVGDLDRYGNAYDNEYYGQGNQFNSNNRKPAIDSASMDSDNLNYRRSDVADENQVFGEERERNEQSQDDSIAYSNDSSDFNEEEIQPAAVVNNSQSSDDRSSDESIENSNAQEDNEGDGADEDSGNNVDKDTSGNSGNDANNSVDENGADDEEEETAASVRSSNQFARQEQQTARFPDQSVSQFIRQSSFQFAPQTQMPQQNPNLPYNAYQYGYGTNFGTYNGMAINSMTNSKNTGVPVSNTRRSSVSAYEEDNMSSTVMSQPTDPKILNHHDINEILSGNRGEITVDETSIEPGYLNEFDQFTDSQRKDSATSRENEIPVVQVPKSSDEPPILMVPDSSDGKLHINHF